MDIRGGRPPVRRGAHVPARLAGGRINADLVRYHQTGTATGWAEVDGERYEISPESWVSTRDHSWGARYDVGQPAVGVEPPPDITSIPGMTFAMIWCPLLFERADGSRYAMHLHLTDIEGHGFSQRMVTGGIEHPDGRHEPFVDIRPEFRFEPDNRRVQGGRIHVTLADGSTRDLRVEVPTDVGFHLGAGLYFGWKGHHHGDWRGELVVDGERLPDCTDPALARQLHQIRDTFVVVHDPVEDANGLGQLPADLDRGPSRARSARGELVPVAAPSRSRTSTEEYVMAYRVIQWSTGNAGSAALRAAIESPDLDLIGVWVHSPQKVGVDAGTLAGVDPVGVAASNDMDALLALDPDVVCYTAAGDLRPTEALTDICRILESGTNVVATSIVALTYPTPNNGEMLSQLEAACAKGASSFYLSGIDPGFAIDLLPAALLTAAHQVDTVRVREVLNYATYDQGEILFDIMGFGKPLDADALLFLPGSLSYAWGGVVHMLAAVLGTELDEVREVTERRAMDVDIEVASGVVKAGTMAAMRFEVQGIVAGEPRVIVEHVTRLHDDAAPDWPAQIGEGQYETIISGELNMRATLQLDLRGGDHNAGGLLATGTKVLNAIPAVCAAAPGVLTTLDLPLRTGMHLLAANSTT